MPRSIPSTRRGRRSLGALLALATMLAAGQGSAQLLSLPVSQSGVVLDAVNDEVVIDFDAGTLPLRARLITTVTPDASHPDLEMELEIDCSWIPVLGSDCNFEDPIQFPYSIQRSFVPGPIDFDANFAGCNPNSPFVGDTCSVVVRAVDFGAAGSPASVDVDLRAYTKVPTGTLIEEFDPVPPQMSTTFDAFRDTTLYERNPTFSNGQGQSIWAGHDAVGTFPFTTLESVHGMMQFNLVGIPGTATIDDATLELHVIENRGPVSRISIAAIDDRDNSPFTSDTWNSGDADAPGDELLGALSLVNGASWDLRTFAPWNVPGASTGPVLDDPLVPTGGGTLTFQSPAFTAEIDRQISTGDDGLGFQLRNDGENPFIFADQAVRFGSGENPTPADRPFLTVFYTPEFAPPISDVTTQTSLFTGTLTFVAEGEDFRWIYDDDGDDVLLTDIGGRCEETYPGNQPIAPWSYAFEGDPSFRGLDCCTWEIEGVNGVVGAGQAIFFLGIDPSEPANQPGDFDGDGIRDLCDNCAYTANGPLLGTCVSPSGGYPDPSTQFCRSDLECAAGDFCSLAQEVVGTCDGGSNNGLACSSLADCPGATRCDLDGPSGGARQGVACPEPGFGGGLALALSSLVLLGRRSPRRPQRGAANGGGK